MITLEQVKLLDLRVTKAVEHIKKITGENAQLRGKLDSYQKRIDDLEVLIRKFKEDQNRIEDGILSALDRLNQFEDALENTLSKEKTISAEDMLPDEGALLAEKIPAKENAIKTETKKKPIQVEVLPEKNPPAQNAPEPSNPDNELDIF